jgi:hypothetical protein
MCYACNNAKRGVRLPMGGERWGVDPWCTPGALELNKRLPSCATIAPLEILTMRDLIGRTLGHYRVAEPKRGVERRFP